jgi:hypothetical protein
MFESFYLFYWGLLFVAALLAYLSSRVDKKFIVLFFLLSGTLLFEIFAKASRSMKIKNYSFTYDIFCGIEFGLFVIYYLKAAKKNSRAQAFAKLLALAFILFSLFAATVVFRSDTRYAWLLTLNLNVEGVLLILIFAHLLFNIDNYMFLPLYKHPDFWISVGIMVFYSGAFVLFVLYPMLRHIDVGEAAKEYGFILKTLNTFLYLSFIFGMLCLLRNRKYLAR